MKVEEFIADLRLNAYKRAIYLWLLKVGDAKAKEICDETRVPYGKIYEMLYSLETDGLVSVIPTKPKTFKAIDPKIALKSIYEEKKEMIEEKIEQLKKIEEIGSIKKPKVEELLVLKGREEYMRMMKSMIDRAEKSYCLIPGRMEQPPSYVRSGFIRMLRRGVKMKILLREITDKNRGFVKERIKLGAEIRFNTLKGMRLSVKDGEEILLSIVDPDTGDRVSVYTTNEFFANSMEMFFDSLWRRSDEDGDNLQNTQTI